MLATARDVWASFFLDKQLSLLREDYMRRVIEKRPLVADYWARGEEQIWRELRANFYSHDARLLVKPFEAGQITDDADFASGTQKLANGAILATHKTLARIPFLGQPEYLEEQ